MVDPLRNVLLSPLLVVAADRYWEDTWPRRPVLFGRLHRFTRGVGPVVGRHPDLYRRTVSSTGCPAEPGCRTVSFREYLTNGGWGPLGGAAPAQSARLATGRSGDTCLSDSMAASVSDPTVPQTPRWHASVRPHCTGAPTGRHSPCLGNTYQIVWDIHTDIRIAPARRPDPRWLVAVSSRVVVTEAWWGGPDGAGAACRETQLMGRSSWCLRFHSLWHYLSS